MPRYKSQKQASKYDIKVRQPALAGGKVDPVYNLGLDTYLVALTGKIGVGMYFAGEERASS